jgi:2-oxoglutarate ferredoxin oxidoreductase subunit alpha
MSPVILLTDAYLGNGAEPWRIPDVESIPDIVIKHPTRVELGLNEGDAFMPYQRDPATLVRPWVIPGTPGLEHRVGSLEKQDITGNVSYDPDNHDKMVRLRAEKIARVADDIPLLKVNGEPSGKTLVLGWGSTEGAILAAVNRLRNAGKTLSCAHLHYLNPMPKNTEEVLRAFDTVIIPEINLGQLSMLIRSRYLIDTISLNAIRGRPLSVDWLEENIANVMAGTHQALAGKE